MKRSAARPAVTAIELLVALVLAAVLVALLLPAVQKAREAANGRRCQDHLRQIGTGLHDYHTANGSFPYGGADGPNYTDKNRYSHNGATRKEWNWTFHLTPHVGQGALYSLPDNDVHNRTIQMTPTRIYYCPSRRAPVVYSNGARTDYAGNAGRETGDNGTTGVFVRVYAGGAQPPGAPPLPVQPARRLGDLRDGAANTLMVGEKQLHLSLANSVDYALSGGDNEAWNNSGWDEDCLRFGGTEGDPVPDETGYYAINISGGGIARDADHPDAETIRVRVKEAMWWSRKFGGSHPAGVNVVMADGSVRVIGFAVDPEQFLRACDIGDGPAVALD